MKLLQAIPKRWLPWLIAGVFALIAIGIAPTLMRHETVVQIRVSHAGATLPDGFYLYQQLSAQGIRIKSITPAGDALIIHFDSEEQSLAAQKVLRRLLPKGFIVAQHEQSQRLSLA